MAFPSARLEPRNSVFSEHFPSWLDGLFLQWIFLLARKLWCEHYVVDNACHGDGPFLFRAASGGLFLTNMRRVALALLLLSGSLGLIFRLGGWNELALIEPILDLRKITAGQNIGPFVADGTESPDRLSLRLPSPQCTGAIFLTASDIYHRPEKLMADLSYPAGEWRSVYVHRGQASTQAPDYPLSDVIRRKVSLLLRSPVELSEIILFSFHLPVGCWGAESAAIAGATAIITSAATANNSAFQ